MTNRITAVITVALVGAMCAVLGGCIVFPVN